MCPMSRQASLTRWRQLNDTRAFQHASVAFDLSSVLKLKKDTKATTDTTKQITRLSAGRKARNKFLFHTSGKKSSDKTINEFFAVSSIKV